MKIISRLTDLFRKPCRPQCFDAAWYLATYADVASAGMDPLRHYLRFGRREGRLPAFMLSVGRDRDLRWGLEDSAQDALGPLAQGAVPDQTQADRVWATLALTRFEARNGCWPAAAVWLETLDPQIDLIGGFCLLDPSLLAIEVWTRNGDFARATAQLARANRQFGALPDLALAQANLTSATHGFGVMWDNTLRALYDRNGLTGVTVAESRKGLSPFDGLCAASARNVQTDGPLVSVIMPARDAATTIATALRSLRSQSWTALEIIVVDNGSYDDTAAIVCAIAAEDPRIRLLDGSTALGAYGARNLGMAAARGAFLTVLDADDWAHPDRIARQADALRKAPAKVVAVMSDWVRTTPDLVFTRWWKEDGLTHPNISSLMIRATAQARLGYWDLVRGGADTEYVARIRVVFGHDAIRIVLPGVPLSFGRLHSGSLTQSSETQIGSYLFGARRTYEAAAARWHSADDLDAALPLAQQPAVRPFSAPAALMLAAPHDNADVESDFNAEWYLHSYADLRGVAIDPLRHFEEEGEREGRSPGPGFSPSAYRITHEKSQSPFTQSPLRHFQQVGRGQGHTGLPGFVGQRPTRTDAPHIIMFGHQAGREVFGAERSLLDTLDSAAEAGVTVSVVLPHILNRPYLEALQARSAYVYVRPYGWRFGNVAPPEATLHDLTELISQTGATQVHVNTCVVDAPLRAARAMGLPSIVYVRELPVSDPRMCIELGLTAHELRNQLLAQADRFVANSEPVRQWLAVAPERVHLVPNRIDAELLDLPCIAFDDSKNRTGLRVGLIGSLVAKKGLKDVIALARSANAQKVPQRLALRFVLIGPMTSDLAAAGALPANMDHIGYLPSPAEAIAQCDIVLSLSQMAESFGRTVLEAMAAGRPVICYDRGMPPDLVGRDGTAGRVVPPDSPEAVLNVLQDWAQDPATLAALSRAARTRARAHQNNARVAARRAFGGAVAR
jgi:glycosyltransferase involved in cell wall biosynthesis